MATVRDVDAPSPPKVDEPTPLPPPTGLPTWAWTFEPDSELLNEPPKQPAAAARVAAPTVADDHAADPANQPPVATATVPTRNWAWGVIAATLILVVVGMLAIDGDDDPADLAVGDTSTVPGATTPAPASATPLSTTTTPAGVTVAPPPTQPTTPTTLPPTTAPIVSSQTPVSTAPATPAPTVPTTAPPTAPAGTQPNLPGFGEGTWLVGSDVQPNRYIATAPTATCTWERLGSLTGAFEDILASDTPRGRAIVDVLPTDVAFKSTGCGDWVVYVPAAPVPGFGDGDWVVGSDVAPGRYATQGGPECYWERGAGFTHAFPEVLASGLPASPVTVDIHPDDVRFTSRGCGTWSPA